MKLPIYQVDTFTTEVFRGNPAAVCPLESWPDDGLLQDIATENQLSATAFLVSGSGVHELRWFTPLLELDLCGHGTLAAAHVFFHYLDIHATEVLFETRGGPLKVERAGPALALDLPALPAVPCDLPEDLLGGLGRMPHEVLKAEDYLVLLGGESEVRALQPDFTRLERLDARGVIVTAPGDECDFVSRFFAPRLGVPEDPVTGSAHRSLVPYWSERLGRMELVAEQVSSRGGRLKGRLMADRVRLAGEAVTYLEGTLTV